MPDLQQLFAGLAKQGRVQLRSDMSLYESILGFLHAVNWRERNVMVLVAFHVLLLVLVIATRRQVETQIALMCTIGAVVMMSEELNSSLATRWRQLGWTQNYFDKSGVFMLGAVTFPLLVIAVIQLVLMLSQALNLMVRVKRAQIREEQRAKAKDVQYEDLPKKTR